jgi:hypothetical protein
MRRKLRTARTFSLGDWWILFQAWCLLLAFDLGLRVLPFPRIQALAAPGQKGAVASWDEGTQIAIRRLYRFVGIAARNHIYPMQCLRQSLALQWLLGRRGIITELQLGVRKEEDELCAHAWLEYAGRPIEGSEKVEAQFQPLTAWETD